MTARRHYTLLRVALLATGATGLMACQGVGEPVSSVEQQRAAITNGAVQKGYPAIGALVAAGTSACTATLVSERTLLTAAHCVDNRWPVHFYVGGLSGARYTAQKVVVHPRYAGGNRADLAMVQLSQPVSGIAALPIATDAPQLGETVVLVGYGKADETAGKFGVKRSTTNVVGKISDEFFSFFTSGGNICDGDSGGPALVKRHGDDVIVGVHSTRGDNCGDEGNDMRVDVYREWIVDQVLELDGTDDGQPPVLDLLSPADGARVGRELSVTASAYDDLAVRKVSLYLDGSVAVSLRKGPFQFQLEALGDGRHQLKLVAEDMGGNTTEVAVDIEVDAARPDLPFGGQCTAASQCQSRLCSAAGGAVSVCTRSCSADAPCRSGFACVEGICQLAPSSGELGAACVDNAGCGTGLCVFDQATGDHFCTESCQPSVGGCPSGSSCTAIGAANVCVPHTSAGANQGGQGCNVSGDAAAGGPSATLLLLAIGALLRRRRR